MKKLLFLTAALLACVFTLSSCSASDKEGTYDFFILEQSNVESAQSLEEIRNLVAGDPYFSSKISYKGKYTEAGTLAINEFLEHTDKLDSKYICSRMKKPSEYFTLTLWSYDPANKLISSVYTADKWSNVPETSWSLNQ